MGSAADRSSSPHTAPTRDIAWQTRASVGTWLGRTSAQENRRNDSHDQQFWPATPEGSLQPAPRSYSDGVPTMASSAMQAVVWVPVPVHLLDKVQQVLNNA